jgi:hypothetical protein
LFFPLLGDNHLACLISAPEIWYAVPFGLYPFGSFECVRDSVGVGERSGIDDLAPMPEGYDVIKGCSKSCCLGSSSTVEGSSVDSM